MLKYELLKPVIYTMEYISTAYELDDNPTIFERVDNITIKLQHYHFNLGKICYLKKKRKREELFVITNSLNPVRIQITKLLLKYINNLYVDGISVLTIDNRLKRVSAFLDYLKDNDLEFDINQQSIKSALIHYSSDLQHKVKIYDRELKIGLTSSTAHNYQRWIIEFSCFMLNIDSHELIDSNDLIVSNSKETIKSNGLSDEILSTEFNQYTYIFRRFNSIVLNHELFPFTFNLNQEIYWITPIGRILHKDNDKLTKSGTFNFKEGKYFSLNEIISSKHYKNTSKRNEAIKLSKQNTDKANTPYSKKRAFIALYACRAYFMHFLFLTGENDSTAASLIFSEDYNIENAETNFKSIKWRSNGQPVKYDIQTEFIEDFRQFLLLRSYLLKCYNKNYKELFLNVCNTRLIPAQISGNLSSQIRSATSILFNENTFIATSKTIRVTKGLWLRENHGSSLSSYILQHSNKTSNSSYTDSNFEKSSEELTNYFSQLSNQLLLEPGKEESTPSGKCIEPNMPQEIPEIISTSLITPACGDQKSCLFCSKYRVHGDEIDIRKLLSIQYFVLQSEYLAHSAEHFKNVYELLLTRIDAVLCQIKELGEEQVKMINELKKQVFEKEELSGYWYRKLELLNELGVL